MRLLLDTCTFLWIVGGAKELSPRAREAFADPANEAFLSAASAWEIAVKHRLGTLPPPSPPEEFVPTQRTAHGFEPLPVATRRPRCTSRSSRTSTATRSTGCSWRRRSSGAW